MPDLPDLPNWADTGLRIALIIAAALVLFLAIRSAARISVQHLLEQRSVEAGAGLIPPVELERRVNTVQVLVIRLAGAIIMVIATLMILSEFAIDIGPAVAGLGVAGIAVGFGAQTLVRDWLAGIFIVLENQYSQGDVVRIAGVDGVVEDFSLRRTALRDLDGTVHNVPNGQITVASNMTRLWARVNLDIGVAYETDIDRAAGIIDRIGRELHLDPEWGPRLLEAPSVARIEALADSAVTLKILGRVRAAEQWAVAGELRKRILAAFAEAGIQIPDAPASTPDGEDGPAAVMAVRSDRRGPRGTEDEAGGAE
ncbi:MAG: mechanosensitive ion channel family protein [Candidatus Limnocylindria bacterium]